MRSYLLIFLTSFLVLPCSSQAQVQQSWANRFTAGLGAAGIDLALDGAGNVYVLAESSEPTAGSDFVTIKYGADGSQTWLAKYGGPNNDFPQALAVDSAGNVYVTGASYGSESGSDFATVKYNPAGQQLWAKTFNRTGNGSDFPVAIAVDASGNVYVTGDTIGLQTRYDYSTVKYDSNGNQLWVATYNGAGNDDDYAIGLAVDGAGNVYVTGFSVTASGDTDYATVKYGPDGRQLWAATYDGPARSDDYPAGVKLDSSGNVYVSGTSAGLGSSEDLATVKYDPAGKVVWVERYNGPFNGSDFVNAMAVSAAGNVYLAGAMLVGTNQDYLTVAYDSAGHQLWEAFYNGPANGSDSVDALALDPAGNVFVAGVSSASPTNEDIVVVKYDPQGSQLWAARYDGPAHARDLPHAVAVDPGGNILVTGSSGGAGGNDDAVTVKFFQGASAGAPAIIKSPLSQMVLRGSDVLFSVAASGAEPLAYQWFFNGAAIPGANAESFRISSAGPANAGAYNVVVRNGVGEITSSTATLRVDDPVVITANPQSQTIAVGQNLSLAVGVSGSPPLTYQWFFEGLPLPGQTGPALLIQNVSFANQGQYRVEVRNPVNVVSSDSALVTVVQPPVIIRQPLSQLVAAGRSLTLSAEAQGSDPLSYQWFFGPTPIANATSPVLVIPNISLAAGGAYTLVVSNPAGNTTSGVANVTVVLPPAITAQPQSRTIAAGANAIFTVGASGTPPLSFQWQYNGVNLPGETSASLVIPAAGPGDSGNYSVLVANAVDAIHSDNAELVVILPSLNLADNFANRANDSAGSFSGRGNNLSATLEPGEPNHAGKIGGKSVWYSWTAPGNGVVSFDTAGSAIDTLLAVYTGSSVNALTPLTANDDFGRFLTSKVTFNASSGIRYNIAIDGLGGASGNIVLSWNFAPTPDQVPVIVQQPQNQTVAPGATATFTVVVQPQNNLLYQWFFENNPISGGTNPVLTVANVQSTLVGNYKVEVRNGSQTAVSQTAVLELGAATGVGSEDKFEDIFLTQTGQLALEDVSGRRRSAFASVSAGSIGTQVMDNSGASTEQGEPNHGGVIGGSSRWFGLVAQVDGVMRVDTIGSKIDTVLAVYRGNNLLNLTLVASDNDGAPDGVRSLLTFDAVKGVNYSVAVDGVHGAQGKITLNWQLGTIPAVTQDPQSVTVTAGANVTLSAAATGTPAPEFQWRLNGADIPGATGPILPINNAQAGDAGNYRVRVRNFAGSILSAAAALTVNTPLTILQQPESQAVASGSGASFSVAASGPGPLRYQWRFNGSNLAGATNVTLSIPNAQLANAGNYSVIISNLVSSATSSNAILTVNASPTITAQPQSLTANNGAAANFSVTAAGTAPLSFQWRFNGVNIPGATSNVFQIASVSSARAGTYSVVVLNPFGVATSTDVTLTVLGSDLRLLSPGVSNNQFGLQLAGPPSRSAVVQFSTNLIDWLSLATNLLTGGQSSFTDSGSQTSRARFYRAVLLP